MSDFKITEEEKQFLIERRKNADRFEFYMKGMNRCIYAVFALTDKLYDTIAYKANEPEANTKAKILEEVSGELVKLKLAKEDFDKLIPSILKENM